jgi:hypothetical protein
MEPGVRFCKTRWQILRLPGGNADDLPTIQRHEINEVKYNLNQWDQDSEAYDEFPLFISPMITVRALSSKPLCYK